MSWWRRKAEPRPEPRALRVVNGERLERLVEPPDWEPRHAGEWRRFLDTETGRVLLHRMRAMHVNLLLAGCQGGERDAGKALGWGDARTWIESLGSDQMISSGQDVEKGQREDTGQA